ncbi:polymorphic toxin type 15 domain-containing protein, partial [Acinetobacter boissieri]
YNTNRYFDAKHERYLTPDPLGLAAGPNLYDFALRQPHQLKDSLGLAPEPNKDYSNQSFAWKLEFILVYAFKAHETRNIMGEEMGKTLQGMVEDLPTTVAMFVTWQIISMIPILGPLANSLMAVYAFYSLGSDALDLAIAIGKWVRSVNNAQTQGELICASKELAKILGQMSALVAGSISPAQKLKKMMSAGKKLSATTAPKQDNTKHGPTKSLTTLERKTFGNICFNSKGAGYQKAKNTVTEAERAKGELDKAGYLKEYDRQVSRQQEALNNMTASEYMAARKAFTDAKKGTGCGRNTTASKAQKDYRDKAQDNYLNDRRKEYSKNPETAHQADILAKKDTDAFMKKSAALHEPDMFAGGYNDPEPTCMGDASVNSSIGTQWKKHIQEMDKYAEKAMQENKGNALLNFKFELCK